jgi:hypothetical protein
MDYIEKILERLQEWADKVIELILGPQGEPETEPIRIPVNDRLPRR